MKNFLTRKNVLVVSGLVTLFLVFLFSLGSNLCYSSLACREFSESKIVDIFNSDYLLTLFVFLPTLLLSLITYKMRDEVFRAWWNFARWIVLVIVLATLLINLMPSNHGFFNMDALIYLLVLAPLYGVFILGSLWKIVRTYRKLKSVPQKTENENGDSHD